MSDGTKIEWTDATANVVNGCSVLSPGCTNCYAMRLAGTRMKDHPTRIGLTQPSKAGPVWTGEVRFNEKALQEVLHWSKPRMIFWNAHGDLFHENVPDAWIDRCFAAMALTPQHKHQVLTKRAARMRAYFASDHHYKPPVGAIADLYCEFPDMARRTPFTAELAVKVGMAGWPLPNVWLGVSVEDQTRAAERIPDLLATPAAVRWISAEPLLGPVDLIPYLHDSSCGLIDEDWPGGFYERCCTCSAPREVALDWVVAGGESGPNARPMHPDWARSVREQCAAAGVPFLFKQWGEWGRAFPKPSETPGNYAMMARDKGGWTHTSAVMLDRYPRQFSAFGSTILERLGKRAAGRLLDGVQHDGYPA